MIGMNLGRNTALSPSLCPIVRDASFDVTSKAAAIVVGNLSINYFVVRNKLLSLDVGCKSGPRLRVSSTGLNQG